MKKYQMLNYAPRHESLFWELEVQIHAFSLSTQDGDERSALRPGHFISGVTDLSTNWIRRWIGPRTCLDTVAKGEVVHYRPCQELNPGR